MYTGKTSLELVRNAAEGHDHWILPPLASAATLATTASSACAWGLCHDVLPPFRATGLPGTNGIAKLQGKSYILTGGDFVHVRAGTTALMGTETIANGRKLKVETKPLRH